MNNTIERIMRVREQGAQALLVASPRTGATSLAFVAQRERFGSRQAQSLPHRFSLC